MIHSQLATAWSFTRNGAETSVAVHGRARVSAAEGLRAAVLADMGLTIATEWMFTPELASGAVQRVLPDWELPPALFPTGRMASAKAREFANFVEAKTTGGSMGEAKRKREAVLNGACPCGSNEVARKCCFDGRNWHRRAASLGLRDLPAAAVVERCYMRELGSCVAPISGEHLISQSVMQVLQGNGEFSIAGVPWLPRGEVRVLGSNALRANCLCTKHNSLLSPIDGAAKHLFQSLKAYLEEDAGEPRHSLVSGHDLEHWALKTAKALAVSGDLARGEERLSGAFAQDNSLIAMLDDPAAWPTRAGL